MTELSMTPAERFERKKLAIETKLKRADQTTVRRQLALAEAQFEWQKTQASQSGWRLLVTPTGVVLVGAALGLLGTAAGKWADYLTTKRQQETTIILKASEVPQSLSAQAQDIQRARNLLWFAEARYIDLPQDYLSQLRAASKLEAGQALPPPIVQSQIAASSLDLIADFESFQPTVTETTAGFRVIGFGHVLRPEELSTGRIKVGDESISFENGITKEQARRILRSDLEPAYHAIDRLVKVPLTSGQRDALASFVYNAGTANFSKSTLLKKLNEGNYEAVTEQLARWASNSNPGLQRRRAAEIELWKTHPRPNVGSAKKSNPR